VAVDRVIADLAGRQHGVVALWQLRRLGVGADAVKLRLRTGRLHRLYRGVYAVGHGAIGPSGHRVAAVLACGAGALLARRSALAAWGIRPTGRSRHDVLVPVGSQRSPAGIDVIRTRVLHPDDVAELDGIPLTSVARALVDFAAIARPEQVQRAVHEAEVLRLLDVRAVEAALDRARGRKGTHHLRAAIAQPSAGPTRRELEYRFLALCRRHGIEVPALNAWVSTSEGLLEVDALWPAQRVTVEVDGAATHLTRRAFERDRRRDAALAAERYTVLRFTWDRVADDEAGVVAVLRRVLER
jgi:hypothetical protein